MDSLSEASVEAYLNNNHDFSKRWFSKHATADWINDWREENRKRLQEPLLVQSGSESEGAEDGNSLSPPAQCFSGRNSITTAMFRNYLDGTRFRATSSKIVDKDALSQLDEREVFMELIRDIANELDVNVLCHKILLNVSILTKSDRGSLFLARGPKNKRVLVSKLFDVTQSSTLEDSIPAPGSEIRVPFGVGIAGHVALSKETVNIQDAYQVSVEQTRLLVHRWLETSPCCFYKHYCIFILPHELTITTPS